MSELDPVTELQEDIEVPLPPPSFPFMVLSLRVQAQMRQGLMHFRGDDEKPAPKRRMARHTIDLMNTLIDKTQRNFELEERRLPQDSVTELRFRFVQISDEVKNAALKA